MRLKTLALATGCLVALSGCGGGGAGVDAGPGPVQQVGPVSVQGNARVMAPTVVPGGAALYGVTGNITNVSFTDTNPTVDETEVVFAAARGTKFAIMACSPDGSGLRVILDDVGVIPRMEVIGDWVYYVDPYNNLRRVKLSGGASQSVRTQVTRFSSNLAGTKIFGYQFPSTNWPNGRFISFNPDGTGVVHMFAAPFVMYSTDYFPGLLSDGSLVLVDNQGSSYTSYRTYSPTGSQRQGGRDHNNTIEGVGMENGTDFVYHKTSGYTEKLLASGISSWVGEVVGGVRYDYDLAIAPGASRIAYANGVTDNLRGILIDTLPPSTIKRIFPSAALVVSWGPLVTSRTFVGSGAPFASAGAFLFSDKGTTLPAVVWADATTRSSIQLTKVSADGAQNTVYRLDCDDLSKLSYSNSLNYNPINVITTTSGIIGVLIALNSDTGKVESLTTFKGTVNATQENGVVKVKGADAVFRADGSTLRNPGALTFN